MLSGVLAEQLGGRRECNLRYKTPYVLLTDPDLKRRLMARIRLLVSGKCFLRTCTGRGWIARQSSRPVWVEGGLSVLYCELFGGRLFFKQA